MPLWPASAAMSQYLDDKCAGLLGHGAFASQCRATLRAPPLTTSVGSGVAVVGRGSSVPSAWITVTETPGTGRLPTLATQTTNVLPEPVSHRHSAAVWKGARREE